MELMKDKRGFLDTEVLFSTGFVILFALAVTATVVGYVWSKKMDAGSLPVWQLIVILVGEFFAAYFFAAKA